MITKDKQYKTRSGHAVRILATDYQGNCPIVGIITYDDHEFLGTWTKDGFVRSTQGKQPEKASDLVEVTTWDTILEEAKGVDYTFCPYHDDEPYISLEFLKKHPKIKIDD